MNLISNKRIVKKEMLASLCSNRLVVLVGADTNKLKLAEEVMAVLDSDCKKIIKSVNDLVVLNDIVKKVESGNEKVILKVKSLRDIPEKIREKLAELESSVVDIIRLKNVTKEIVSTFVYFSLFVLGVLYTNLSERYDTPFDNPVFYLNYIFLSLAGFSWTDYKISYFKCW